MVESVSVAGLCITAVILCKIIEKYNKEQAVVLSIAGISAVMIAVCSLVSPLIASLNSIFESADIEYSKIQIIFKALGISYITQLTSDICRDCGESAVASSAETAGKIIILAEAMPLFNELISTVSRLL